MKALVPQTITVAAAAGGQPSILNIASAGRYFYCQQATTSFGLQFDAQIPTTCQTGFQIGGSFSRLTFSNSNTIAVKSKLTLIFSLLALSLAGQSVPTNYPVIPFSTVPLQNLASNQDAMVLMHWTGSNYISRRMPIMGLTNLYDSLSNSFLNRNFIAGTFTNPSVSGGTFTNANLINPVGTLATTSQQGIETSNTVLQAFTLPYNAKMMVNNGKPIMGYDNEYTANTTNNSYAYDAPNLTNMMILGGVAAGYKTFFADLPNIIGHTNSGGVWYPVVTNLWPSPTELNGTGFKAFNQNILKPMGMQLGLLVDSSFDDGHGGPGIGGHWYSDIAYATTNWGVTAWQFPCNQTAGLYPYTMQCLQAIQAIGSNPWISLLNFSDKKSAFAPNGEITNINFSASSALPFWSPYVNWCSVQDADPVTYQSWFTNFFKYIVPALPLEAPGFSISETIIYGYDPTEQWNTQFQMDALTRAPLIIAAFLNPWDLYQSQTPWMILNPALIAVDQNVDRPPVYQAFTTNGVTFFVGAADSSQSPNTWYLAVWNTNSSPVTSVTIPTSVLNLQGWSSGTPLTVWDATMQATYEYATNLLSFTNYLNGGSGYCTNLAAGGATLYCIKRGIVSDWTAGTHYLSDPFPGWPTAHPITMWQTNAGYSVIGFNRNEWNGSLISDYTNLTTNTFFGSLPSHLIDTRGPYATLTYPVWPATNFSCTFGWPDGNGGTATNIFGLSVYGDGILLTNVSCADGSSNFLSIPISCKFLTLTMTNNNNPLASWMDLINPMISVPFSTAYNGNNIEKIYSVGQSASFPLHPSDGGMIFNAPLTEGQGTNIGSYLYGTTAVGSTPGQMNWQPGWNGMSLYSTNHSSTFLFQSMAANNTNSIFFSSIPDSFSSISNFTFECLYGQPTWSGSQYPVLFGFGLPGGNNNGIGLIFFLQNSLIALDIQAQGSAGSFTANNAYNSLTNAGWHQLVCTWDGTNIVSYLNDVAFATNAFSGVITNYAGRGIIEMGSMSGGNIGETGFWNRALSTNEIRLLYRRAFPQ